MNWLCWAACPRWLNIWRIRARKVELREPDVFRLACLDADRDLAQFLLSRNPGLIAETLLDVAKQISDSGVAELLESALRKPH